MLRHFTAVGFALLVTYSAASAQAATVHVNRDDAVHSTNPENEETGTWVFTNNHPNDTAFPMPSPSSTDLANGVLPVLLPGGLSPHNGFGTPLPKLTNGLTATSADDPTNSFFFLNGTTPTGVRISLAQAAKITSINSYSWHRRLDAINTGQGERNQQHYDVYGAGSSIGDPNDINNYVFIATVNTVLGANAGSLANANQTGVSIVPSSGDSLGIFQHFIFVIHPSVSNTGSQGTFYSEIDIHGTFDIGSEVPEPSTLASLGFGLVSLVVMARRKVRRA